MLIVDASCLFEVLVRSPQSEAIRQRLALDPDHAAPHIVDVEVFGIIRRDYRLWDAMYVALAEALGSVLLSTDARLARVTGPACEIELVG